VASGLRNEIDELDQLLDKLLRLPIDRVTTSSNVLPMKPVESSRLSLQEDEEPAVLALPQPPVELRVVSTPSLQMLPLEEDASLIPLPALVEPETPVIAPPVTEEVIKYDRTIEPVTVPVVVEPIQPGSAQWFEDEPLPVPTASSGPKVEIIHGPHSEIVRASEPADDLTPSPTRKWSILFWMLWTITWLFDNTLGSWFPFLRRPSVKFLLGLIGLVLLAISVYLVWQGLTR
jgi:hypothetical protein